MGEDAGMARHPDPTTQDVDEVLDILAGPRETQPGERAWTHPRKGTLHGVIVREDGGWTTIRLTRHHREADAGEELTVRTAWLTPKEASMPQSWTADDIVDTLPAGYRWATANEAERWNEHAGRMVQVRRGDGDETDLAIRSTHTKKEEDA